MLSKQNRIALLIAVVTILSSFAAYQPARLYFYGDSWDILFVFFARWGWREIWQLHNDHFLPVSKAILFFQYLLFGMNNYPYQVVNILIHAANTVLLYFYAAEFSPLLAPRVFGALFFGLSGAFWEVTMWETGQQISLALSFLLICLLLHARWLRRRDSALLGCALLSGLCACCSMGFGLLVIPLLVIQGVALGWPQWKRPLASSSLLAFVILLGYEVLLWSHSPQFANPGHIAGFNQVPRLIPWILVGIRGGLLAPSATILGPVALGGLLFLLGLFFWRSFLSWDRLFILAIPAVMMLGSYLMTGLGRMELGIGTAASSRYQYLPAAALGLGLAWIAGGVFVGLKSRYPAILLPLTLVILLTLPVHAIFSFDFIRQRSPRFAWGQQAHRFVDLAVYQRGWQAPPPARFVSARN